MTKLSFTILISLLATLLVSSPAFGAKEKFKRTKPHVNVGAQNGYLSREYQSPLAREAFISAAGQPQRNPVVNKLRGTIKISESEHQKVGRPRHSVIQTFKQEIDRSQNGGGGYTSQIRFGRDAENGKLFDGQYFTNKSTHSTGQSNEPVNGLWVDSDSDGYGNFMGNTGRTVTPGYREATGVRPLTFYQERLAREAYINTARQPQSNLVVNRLRGTIKMSVSESSDPPQ